MTTTNAVNGESFDMDYRYDAVGSALEMVQSSWNLVGKAQDALTQWSYDARYRLTNETVTTYSQSTNPPIQHSTSYAWDAADNRLSKTVAVAGGGDPGSVSTVSYTNNALNQIVGYVEISGGSGSTSTVTFVYDANGSRTNKTETVSTTSTVSTNLTTYTYDEDNRLTGVSQSTSNLPPSTSVFAYDYRSRRYCRATPAETNLCVFDGGLSVQEYDISDPNNQSPITDNLRTEYVRGEGMGGGVGGMVYSLKHEDGNVKLVASHSNHRGDIIARSDENGSLTSFALYEAYGTRPYEWGSDPDRFKANTKQEEKSLGLLNEGRRYRDLETGTFLTGDPAGFTDGANRYCYVHCNPITHFDAVGLKTGSINPFSANFVAYNAVVNTGRHLGEAGHQIAKGNPVVAARVTVGAATSALSGDLFDSKNPVLADQTAVSQNGIRTGDTGADQIAQDAKAATGQETHAVQNGTHAGGLGDLIQCISEAAGAINTPSLNSAGAQREIAKNHGSGTLENTAHSQGTSVARGAADLVKGEGINERTSYQGFGGQITPKDGVYKDTYNERGPSATDALVTHADPRGWMHQGNYTPSTAADHGWQNYGQAAVERAEKTEKSDPQPTVEQIYNDLKGSQ